MRYVLYYGLIVFAMIVIPVLFLMTSIVSESFTFIFSFCHSF